MAWIKRNLFFVISAAVGLLLTGYCGYLLYSALDANSGASDDYKQTEANLEGLQQTTPFPSKENIQIAVADQAKVRNFLAEFRKSFAPFPPPPVKDDKGFKVFLEESLVQFRAEATNAGVQLPPEYSFAFSGLTGRLNYPPGAIAAWMLQLQEIKTILGILYHAKINSLASLARVPVSVDDAGSGDLLQATTVTNQWGIVTPYKITFRGFSTEVAAVMEGFARSSNCFIIQAINVTEDMSARPVETPPTPQQPMVSYAPTPRMPAPAPYSRGGVRGEGIPGIRGAPAPYTPPPPQPSAAPMAAPASPVIFLSENPLVVTLSVNVVKLKTAEHP